MHGSLRITRGVQGFTIAAALIAGWASLALAEGNRRVGTNFVAKRSAAPPETNANDRVDELLNCLLGPDVAVSNEHLNAKANASGTFTGKLSVLGFDQGIILSSGNIGTLDGPNTGDATSTDNNDLGDPDLDALIPGYETFDAAVLEFDFECSSAQEISFQYVFGSEEYNEYVDSPFNDVFGFFLNGVNIAGTPAGCSDAGLPVSINNVNCGNPHVGQGPNCDCFRNNDLDDGGGLINTEMDGLTQVFFATGTIQPGLNHIKIAIADAGDHILDSDVMIRCQSFTCGGAPVVGSCCLSHDHCATLTYEDCIANGGEFHGDLVPCSPNPCSEAVGACCFPDHACEVEGRHGCEQNGGTYLGDNVACNPEPCAISTGVDPTSGSTPSFSLSTPSPTPSHSSVGITWSLPEAGALRLTVWDAAGRQRASLLSEEVGAGSTHRVFQLRDDAGRELPSGMYWLRLESGRNSATQKLVIVN